MPLPSAIQGADAEADALIESLGNTGDNPTPDNNELHNNPNDNGTPATADPAAPTPSPTDDIDWKHKYDVLKGKFNATVPSLQEKVRQLESQPTVDPQQLTQLQQQVAQLEQRNSQLEQTIERQKTEGEIKLNPYLVEQYGEEFAKAVNAQTSAVVDSLKTQHADEITALRSEFSTKLQSTEQSVSQVSSDTRMATLKAILHQQGMVFEQVNSDPMFHDFCREVDRFSGQPRQVLLEQAFNSGDMERTALFYIDFMATQKRAQQSPFQQHVTPQQTTTSESYTATQQPQMFDQNAFEKLHRDFRRGLMTEDEFNKREAELFAALNG